MIAKVSNDGFQDIFQVPPSHGPSPSQTACNCFYHFLVHTNHVGEALKPADEGKHTDHGLSDDNSTLRLF